MKDSMTDAEIDAIDAWWRAANYLSVGQIYLLDNPLLREPLRLEHVKKRLLGHWGTTPGLNFIYAHLNRAIRKQDLQALFVTGPGHGGPALVASTWLEGTFSELYPDVGQDAEGMRRLFRQFSFPGGIGSHCTPEVPGSIHEGGELGYSLAHAFGAALDDPDAFVACVVGDGEAETGALAAAWHSNKFLNPATDGVVLPILHLNGYKIANPAILARIPREELASLMEGYGWKPWFVEVKEARDAHVAMARALDGIVAEIRAIQRRAREQGDLSRPRWPMMVFVSPKGWTGPATIDGHAVEGSWRSHQVPFGHMEEPGRVAELERWLRSYRPEELFDERGAPVAAVRALAPQGDRRMGATPRANGGGDARELLVPDWKRNAVAVAAPGAVTAEATRVMGTLLRDVMRANEAARNFRVVGPDETASNKLDALFEATTRTWVAERHENDPPLEPGGRVMEILSEHSCQGWLEGYTLTGRHGLFSCYEAFIHIVDSMFNQHAKWLDTSRDVPWRKPVPSLNILLTSHVWRQDHNGFSHQDPGFIDVACNKKPAVVRVYLPPDANTLLWVADECLRSRGRINVIVAGKNDQPQWLDAEAAARHCERRIGVFEWASTDAGRDPDVVLACAGDVPTIEALAARELLLRLAPEVRVRVVNVVDLMALQPPGEHPNGLTDEGFEALFTADRPVIFAYHGYPWLIHRLTYRRANHVNFHVRGYKEEGTTTTPFDMAVLNDIDRYRLVMDVARRVPKPGPAAAELCARMEAKRAEHHAYIRAHGVDMPEVTGWRWSGA
jgi:xylulose-5-phosphate/fructose-6-phosphate phosphoketolase